MKMNLRGKTALVTGASSGLGEEFARQFAEFGCSLILVARRLERLLKLQAEISERYDVHVECMAVDLTNINASKQLYVQLKESGHTVDILANNAGFGLFGEFWSTPWERLHQMLELDIISLTLLPTSTRLTWSNAIPDIFY